MNERQSLQNNTVGLNDKQKKKYINRNFVFYIETAFIFIF